jgi:hypothetical protein
VSIASGDYMTDEDKLYKVAKFYSTNLEGKRFILRAGKKSQTIEFIIYFGVEHFKHLVGLNKLKDVRIGRLKSETGYFEILHKVTTYEDIKKSEYFYLIEQRINNFEDVHKALFGKELLIKSLHGTFNTIKADFMLTHKDCNYGYAHLFFKEDKSSISVPVTFIISETNTYLQNNPNKWTVLSVEEVVTNKNGKGNLNNKQSN